jgi:hypothetical protein
MREEDVAARQIPSAHGARGRVLPGYLPVGVDKAENPMANPKFEYRNPKQSGRQAANLSCDSFCLIPSALSNLKVRVADHWIPRFSLKKTA